MATEHQKQDDNNRSNWFGLMERFIAFVAGIGGTLFIITWFLGRRFNEGYAGYIGLPLNQVVSTREGYVEVGALQLIIEIIRLSFVPVIIWFLLFFLVCIYIIEPALKREPKGVILVLLGALIFILNRGFISAKYIFFAPVACFVSVYLAVIGSAFVLIARFGDWISKKIREYKIPKPVSKWIESMKGWLFNPSGIPEPDKNLKKALSILIRAFFVVVVSPFVIFLFVLFIIYLSDQAFQSGEDQARRYTTINAQKVLITTDEQIMNAVPTVISTDINGESQVIFVYDTLFWLGSSSSNYYFYRDIEPSPSCKPIGVSIVKAEHIQQVELKAEPIDKGCAPTPEATASPSPTPLPVTPTAANPPSP